ncbi:MAG: response regulator [Syntrophobacteraceae bacterium]
MQSTDSIPRGFTGMISLGLTELIQMVCLSRSDLVIGVNSGKGSASIYIRQGQIQHAHTEMLTGTEAFFEVARWNDGQFEIHPYKNGVPCSIDKPWEHLLLEAIRLRDENGLQEGTQNRSGDCFDAAGADLGRDLLDGLDDVLGNLLAFDSPRDPPQKEQPAASRAACSPVKVLIVEDSALFAKKLKGMLETEEGIEVVGIARNGKESLEFLSSGTLVDVITLDVNMPVMPGDTAIKHFMIQYRTPVIIVSAQEPGAMDRIFNFLQLGAVDFFAKPEVRDDPASYGARLRRLVKGVAKARISNFKRLRTRENALRSIVPAPVGPARRKTLVVIGAEGAHMDWLRLPLRQLCLEGPVIGIQKLPSGVAPEFARFLSAKTGIETEWLYGTHRIVPGKFYLCDAGLEPEVLIKPNKPLYVDVIGSTVLEWVNGVGIWLERLAERLADSMCVYYMSGAEPAPESVLTELFDRGVTLILAPIDSVVCSHMIESVQPYGALFSDQVLNLSHDSLTEVLKK